MTKLSTAFDLALQLVQSFEFSEIDNVLDLIANLSLFMLSN